MTKLTLVVANPKPRQRRSTRTEVEQIDLPELIRRVIAAGRCPSIDGVTRAVCNILEGVTLGQQPPAAVTTYRLVTFGGKRLAVAQLPLQDIVRWQVTEVMKEES